MEIVIHLFIDVFIFLFILIFFFPVYVCVFFFQLFTLNRHVVTNMLIHSLYMLVLLVFFFLFMSPKVDKVVLVNIS